MLVEDQMTLESPLIINLSKVHTNMVFVNVSQLPPGRDWFLAQLEKEGI